MRVWGNIMIRVNVSQTVEAFMATNGISKNLNNQVFRYYADVWLRFQEEAEMWGSIEDLGPTIRAKVLAEMVRKWRLEYSRPG